MGELLFGRVPHADGLSSFSCFVRWEIFGEPEVLENANLDSNASNSMESRVPTDSPQRTRRNWMVKVMYKIFLNRRLQ